MLRKFMTAIAAVCAVLSIASASVQAQSAPTQWGVSGVQYYSSTVGVVKVNAYSWHIPGYSIDNLMIVSSQGYLLGRATSFLSASYSNNVFTLVLSGWWKGTATTFTLKVLNDGSYMEPASVSIAGGPTINQLPNKALSGWMHLYYL